jgi:hypothetical protein
VFNEIEKAVESVRTADRKSYSQCVERLLVVGNKQLEPLF